MATPGGRVAGDEEILDEVTHLRKSAEAFRKEHPKVSLAINLSALITRLRNQETFWNNRLDKLEQ